MDRCEISSSSAYEFAYAITKDLIHECLNEYSILRWTMRSKLSFRLHLITYVWWVFEWLNGVWGMEPLESGRPPFQNRPRPRVHLPPMPSARIHPEVTFFSLFILFYPVICFFYRCNCFLFCFFIHLVALRKYGETWKINALPSNNLPHMSYYIAQVD